MQAKPNVDEIRRNWKRYQKNDSTLKVIVVGPSSSGKTSIIKRIQGKGFSSTYKSTIGADFEVNNFEHQNQVFTIQLWDTAGRERFSSLGNFFARGAFCALIVFDTCNRNSFYDVDSYFKEYPDIPFKILLGNKTDLRNSKERMIVTDEEAMKWAMENKVAYFPISAKENINIDKILPEISSQFVSIKGPEDDEGPSKPKEIEEEISPTFLSSISKFFLSIPKALFGESK